MNRISTEAGISEKCYAEAYAPVFTRAFPNIYELEALNLIMVVMSLRPNVCTGANVVVNTDNPVSVYAI